MSKSRAKKRRAATAKPGHKIPPARNHRWTLAAVVCLAIAGVALLFSGSAGPPGASTHAARQIVYVVVGSYVHDLGAFLQGLLCYDGGYYESTGLEGRSTLRRVEFPSGKVLKTINIAREFFAEGVALVDN